MASNFSIFLLLGLLAIASLLAYRRSLAPPLQVVTRADGSTVFRQRLPPLSEAGQDVFQPLTSDFHHFYLFNAYQDYRSAQPLVRVIAVGNRFTRLPLFCHLLFPGRPVTVVTVPVDAHREFFLPFQQQVTNDGFFLRCSFFTRGRPAAVSVSTSARHLGDNLIRVRRIPPSPPPALHSPGGIIACVAPLHDVTNASRLAEWVEVNRVLGVERVIFYNFSMSPPVARLLRHYASLGVAEVVPWSHLPVDTMRTGSWPPHLTRIHYFGQFITFNDCLFRAANHAPYVLFIDLDELVVPYRDANLTQCLRRLQAAHEPSAFSFQNVYFPNEFADEPGMARATREATFLLRRTHRESRVLPFGVGSKLATVGDRVLIMGVHNYAFSWAGAGMHAVAPEDALLHHYRSPPSSLRLAKPDPGRREPRLLQFADAVARRVRQALAFSENDALR